MAKITPAAKSATAPPRTKKAARALGYANYLEVVRKGRFPKRDAQPLVVKGEEFFADEDCEKLVAGWHMWERGLCPHPDAQPVVLKCPAELPWSSTPTYRECDAIPLPKRQEVLDAIRRVSREVTFRRQPAWEDASETPLSLVERGISYAWSQGYLMFIGRTRTVALYSDGHCYFRSTVVPPTVRHPEVYDAVEIVLEDKLNPPGVHTELTTRRRRRGENSTHTSPDVVEAVRALTLVLSDKHIAGFLNRNGLRTGRGNRWSQERVYSLRHRRGIPGHSPERKRSEGWMHLTEAAAYLGVEPKTVRRAAERGEIEAMHPLPDGPWVFKREHLDRPSVREVIERARQRRKRGAGQAPGQLSLLPSSTYPGGAV